MNQDERLQMEAQAMLAFGQALMSMGQEIVPMVVAIKPHSDERLLITARPFGPDEKTLVFGAMAAAARIWGASDVVVLVDSFIRKANKKVNLDDLPMPSEDPLAHEALLVHAFRTVGSDFGFLRIYHHTEQGLQFDPLEEVPQTAVDADRNQGLIPQIVHGALDMSDEQVQLAFAEAKAQADELGVPGTSITTFDEFADIMRENGYAVMVA